MLAVVAARSQSARAAAAAAASRAGASQGRAGARQAGAAGPAAAGARAAQQQAPQQARRRRRAAATDLFAVGQALQQGRRSQGQAVCVTVKDGRVESGLLVVSVAIIEMDGEQKKLLRMSLPYGVALQHGTRLIVDQGQPATSPFVTCLPPVFRRAAASPTTKRRPT